uniref:Uncharacterized protein n=1 Tax=Candidatus Methanophaga sp. ANME-1 ERB7 TaxID=2759913 RepID=A0A7G9Z9J6_9EURY|nr:hypothetical protein KMABBJJO_00009 [Methanosarcinales archaeon ANME-1 ERB7]
MSIRLYLIYTKKQNVINKMMPEREETSGERRARWLKREAERAEEGGRKVKKVRCSRCGKEIEEFMDLRGRVLCIDCYAEEDVNFSLP